MIELLSFPGAVLTRCLSRVCTTNSSPLWMKWVDLSLRIPLDSSRLSPSGSKSTIQMFLFLSHPFSIIFLYRWAESNIRKGQAGVSPKDVYGSRV